MLSFPSMTQAARRQMRFKSLCLRLDGGADPPNDWEDILRSIRMMYPNLSRLEYRSGGAEDWPNVQPNLDFVACFGGLQSLKIELNVSTERVIELMDAILDKPESFRRLEVFGVTDIAYPYLTDEGRRQSARWKHELRRGNEPVMPDSNKLLNFVQHVGSFLNSDERPERLISLTLSLKKTKSGKLRWRQSEDTVLGAYWTPWLNLLGCIESLDRVFDGIWTLKSLPLVSGSGTGFMVVIWSFREGSLNRSQAYKPKSGRKGTVN